MSGKQNPKKIQNKDMEHTETLEQIDKQQWQGDNEI